MFELSRVARFFRRHLSFTDILYIPLLIALFATTRLINLDALPIFTDEGIYIHWARVAWHDPSWRFISLTDGKQPLHTWGMIPFLKLFPTNLLLGGRMFSVLTGFVAMTGISTLCAYLWGKRAGYIAAMLYIVTPMFLFYDRMALADSAVNAGAVWTLFFSILLVRTRRIDVAVGFAIAAGFALLTKSSSRMFVGLSALAPLLVYESKVKSFVTNSLNYYILFGIASICAFAMYSIQRLSPFYHLIGQKNLTFVLSTREFLQGPFALLANNIGLIPYYVASEMGYVSAIIGVVGMILLARRDWRLALYLCSWIILPYLAIAAFGKVIFPRYLIFLASVLTVPAVYFLNAFVKKHAHQALFALAIGLPGLYWGYTIWFDQQRIPFPPVDRGQYIESFNAGWGVRDIALSAHEQSLKQPVILIVEGNFGVAADMIEASLPDGSPVTVKGYWPLNRESLIENQKYLGEGRSVQIVFSHRQEFPEDWPMKLVKKYPNPTSSHAYHVYQLVD